MGLSRVTAIWAVSHPPIPPRQDANTMGPVCRVPRAQKAPPSLSPHRAGCEPGWADRRQDPLKSSLNPILTPLLFKFSSYLSRYTPPARKRMSDLAGSHCARRTSTAIDLSIRLILCAAFREQGRRLGRSSSIAHTQSHSSAPFFHAYQSPTSRMPMKTSISTRPNRPRDWKRTAQGMMKITSMSKITNSIAMM